jgi:hypothetical protein
MICVSTDVREQAQRCKACSAGAAGIPGGGSPAAVATPTPDDHSVDVHDVDSSNPRNWSDLSSNAVGAAAATPTSTSSASPDATGA